ncbi:MarR family winged helix-turn-helix transcriptional regulator [Arthrobacter sp. UM1]|uniref:MarR family winged helix-turn-helix transcriptional regulator n=1 Tax=Arthrobacter sp. UM1 TaxID=2766776 RepID=UPI001CF6543B|nr:MarR family transcriptional regulator [Arthrobacter sp. UM1]MCB4208190.1 MarR family transcriptional regulator [Arthrobacter sp. UM1]
MENATPDRLAEHLQGTLELLVRRLRADAADEALSQSAAGLMVRLDLNGPQRIMHLARQEGVSQPAMTQSVDRLEREGLVERHPSAEDRRAVVVELTDAGRETLQARRARRRAKLSGYLAELDAEDQTKIAAAIRPLERFSDVVAAAARPCPTGKETA